MNEFELIQKAKNGDRKAFCELYDQYKDRLYRYAVYRLRNHTDAEDAVSECVLSAWKQIGTLREAKAFPAWIFHILAACCNRMIKVQIRRKDTLPLEDGRTGQPEQSEGQPESMSRRLLLEEALDSLSTEERNIVLLSVVGGLKSNEISEITGLTAGSVRSSLSRSLKKMRGYFE